ncbi:hypothetical protein DA2_2385 [Desulfovibrio sp. A2]|nr:hypothetical protein DA2_2385 [Desulfovibrio sp. A2]
MYFPNIGQGKAWLRPGIRHAGLLARQRADPAAMPGRVGFRMLGRI